METLWSQTSLLAAAAVSGLFSAIWEGTVLAVCVFICLRMFPRLSAAARSAVWISVFLLLMLLHVAPATGGHDLAGLAGRTAPFHFGIAWSLAIAAAWFLISIVRGAQLAISAVRVRGLARRAIPVVADENLQKLLHTKLAGGMRRSAELCVSREVERPSVLGFFKPRILIPPALMERLTSVELQQVVVHEMEHLRRADDWTNLLQKLALVVFPLNPALVWVERRLCAERELACDDSVLRAHGGRKAYAICLTHLAEYSMLRRGLSLALGAWERQSELVRRVHRILRRPTEAMSSRQTFALSGGVIAGVVACALGLARSPQLVSFDTPMAAADAALIAPVNLHAMNPEQRISSPGGMETRAQMVNAIMPGRAASSGFKAIEGNAVVKTSPTKVAMRRARRSSLNMAQRASAQQASTGRAWVVMTAWSESEMTPRIVFTVAQDVRNPQDAAGQEPETGELENKNPARVERKLEQAAPAQPVQKKIPVMSYPVVRTTYAVPLPDGWLIIQI